MILIFDSVWIGNKASKMYSLHSSKWYLAAFALWQRMLNFVQNFEYYMMFVVEQNWLVFQSNMENVSSPIIVTDWIIDCLIDEMIPIIVIDCMIDYCYFFPFEDILFIWSDRFMLDVHWQLGFL